MCRKKQTKQMYKIKSLLFNSNSAPLKPTILRNVKRVDTESRRSSGKESLGNSELSKVK